MCTSSAGSLSILVSFGTRGAICYRSRLFLSHDNRENAVGRLDGFGVGRQITKRCYGGEIVGASHAYI